MSAHCQENTCVELLGLPANPITTPPNAEQIIVKIHCSRGNPGHHFAASLTQASFYGLERLKNGLVFAVIPDKKLIPITSL
jgi:hypothetical protein